MSGRSLEFNNVPIPSEGLTPDSPDYQKALEEEARRYRRIVEFLKDGDLTVNVHLALVRVVCFGPSGNVLEQSPATVAAAFRTEIGKIHAQQRKAREEATRRARWEAGRPRQ